MKIEMELQKVTREYFGEKCVELVYHGKSSTIFKHFLALKLTEKEAREFKVAETMTVEVEDGKLMLETGDAMRD